MLVLVTGDDVARIARTLGVEPWLFTQTVDAPAGDPMGFALDGTAKRYRLALAHSQLPGRPAGCTFLFYAPDGAARCGLGALRPAPCRSYPAQLVDGEVVLDAGACSCEWPAVSRDDADPLRELLRSEASARGREAGLVRAWNAFVLALAPESTLDRRDFCRFLLDRYEPAS